MSAELINSFVSVFNCDSYLQVLILMSFYFSAPAFVHGVRISGLEARMDQVEDRICDLDARGSEEADNLANDHDLDRFILTGKFQFLIDLQSLGGQFNFD